MGRILIFFCVFLLPFCAFAQKEGNVWTYGEYSGLDFNSSVPPPGYFKSAVENFYSYRDAGSASICDKDGNLLFYTNGAKIWNSSHITMPGGILLSGQPMQVVDDPTIEFISQSAAIVQDPSNRYRYYVFHMLQRGKVYQDTCSLFYTIVDMRLNNGRGGVLAGFKNILIDDNMAYGLTIANGDGCNVWIICRSVDGAFHSYELTKGGLNTLPVKSYTGPLEWGWGMIKMNNGDTQLGYSFYKRASPFSPREFTFLGLFDFNRSNGEITHYLDIINIPFWLRYIYGFCFSPNDSKLYYSWRPECIGCGYLSQIDLSLGTPAAILASEIPVNGASTTGGDVKLGPDGYVYIAKGYGPAPGYARARWGLFHIVQPDLPGLSCQFIDTLIHASFDSRSGNFPNDVSILPRDTLTSTKDVLVCGMDSFLLVADTPGSNYIWFDGDTSFFKLITKSGIYYLEYQTGCVDRFDTFMVTFQQLPTITWDSLACEGQKSGRAYAFAKEETLVTYFWRNNEGNTLRHFQSSKGDILEGLNPGNYRVQITTESGCDTTINFTIGAYPQEELIVDPKYATIKYGDSIQLNVSGGVHYLWLPAQTLDNVNISNPIANPKQPTRYLVISTNENGCRDTAYVQIDIDYTMPDLIPNAFSPNGDGVNDVFKVEGIKFQRVVAFQVYNRWGALIFESTDANKGWDGMHNGRLCDMDTYHYFIQLAYPDGTLNTYKGDVTLIR